jgi:hypothetical protein
MTPASDNTYISIEDKEATDFRASIVEFLMTNHPHGKNQPNLRMDANKNMGCRCPDSNMLVASFPSR